MWTLRQAGVTDLRIIYDFENVPIRQEVLDSELPPWPEFLKHQTKALEEGTEKYFFLEHSGIPQGFARLSHVSGLWYVTTWGRWLKTLIYCVGLAAFDYLKVPRLVWNIRESNKRWIKVYEKYPFQFLGENSVFVTLNKPPYIGVTKILYYGIEAETFYQNRELFIKYSLPLEVRW